MISFQQYLTTICETADAGLAAKASKSGISIGTLRKVYRRGVAAWNSGHRPGTTPQQWGMARVNSYIGKGSGTYHGADKDLREQEELEYISELSKETLKSYISKATKDMGERKRQETIAVNRSNQDRLQGKYGQRSALRSAQLHKDKAISRASGIGSAARKFAEEQEIEEANLPEVPKDKESGLPKKYVAGLSTSTAKARAAHFDKMDKKSDSDPSAYEPAPGDANAKTKLSKHTLKYRAMFGEDMEEEIYEACWDTHKQVGMKKKGNRMVPDCVPKNEEVEAQFDLIEELVMDLASQHNIDPEIIWEKFEAIDDEELYEAAVDAKGHKSSTGGLTQKGRDAYNAKGANLQAPVTTPPSKLKAGSKAANRRKSFCARMGGMEGSMKKPNGEPTRKALALRKWNC
jgi:hypothetical protein